MSPAWAPAMGVTALDLAQAGVGDVLDGTHNLFIALSAKSRLQEMVAGNGQMATSAWGHGPPLRRRSRHVRCTSESCRLCCVAPVDSPGPITDIRTAKTAVGVAILSVAAGALGRAKKQPAVPSDSIRNPTDQPQALSSC
jgi:hypothetical protein